jgi:hypothetical protein
MPTQYIVHFDTLDILKDADLVRYSTYGEESVHNVHTNTLEILQHSNLVRYSLVLFNKLLCFLMFSKGSYNE